jgi:DNA-binding NarL/FixJ family response regulator
MHPATRHPARPSLLVADPSPLFLHGISQVGELVGVRVAMAPTPAELSAAAAAWPPDLLLANPAVWDGDGWRRLGELCALRRDAAVGILVEQGRRWEIQRAMLAGYDAYLDKRCLTAQLLPDVIQTLLAGGSVYLATERSSDPPGLSLRELEILQLLRDGYGVREISQRLFLGERTVKAAINSATRHLGAANRVQAVALGYELGLLSRSARHA